MKFYKNEMDKRIGYVPTAYLKPRERDVPFLEAAREARRRDLEEPIPVLTYPRTVSSAEWNQRKQEIADGKRFGRKK